MGVTLHAQHFHFIGIGGAGMSGLAKLVAGTGARVSGSDLCRTPFAEGLERLGISVSFSQRGELLRPETCVVVSSAIAPDNRELATAKAMGLKILHRARLLSTFTNTRPSVCVSGSHGKSTLTALLAYLLERAGLDPAAAVGATMRNYDDNVLTGGGPFVCEADESDGSLLHYHPSLAVVTNADDDHLDYHRDLGGVVRTFGKFLDNVREGGKRLLGADCENLAALAPRADLTYGFSPRADVQVVAVETGVEGSRFYLRRAGVEEGPYLLSIPGRHNVQNAAAAVVVAQEMGVEAETIARALPAFSGLRRRLEVKGCCGDVLVMDDYGHHPTEIAAVVETLEPLSRRLVVVFQPHRYSRTRLLLHDFPAAFRGADKVVVLDIYGAGESPGEVSAQRLAEVMEAVLGKERVVYAGASQAALAWLEQATRPGDLVLTLGAGDVDRVGELFLAALGGFAGDDQRAAVEG